ncbi:Thiosulfate reductase cytochrome b subunit [Cohaesibacter sp. ES.047]|uniref:cytochrome b/b6 domain-containing protein n=1 Tax=Cohaesibacter sp. ES.047 TaxID=1798205 RepID=UPI000BC047AD|nr:cytochrome b/b6 domain-containing protein [Cohaesibacter sp. ES.047]SNY91533.1 Thiosulfate reductase cytochrome b subunit [Cohaesibacter sp. ES.047]
MTDIPSPTSGVPMPDPARKSTPGKHSPNKRPPNKRSVKIYTRYERFWHWSQALLIFILALSGFNLHGTLSFVPFPLAVMIHTFAAITLIVLWLFTTFWNFTTGQWRHYLPQNKGLFAVIKFYAWGIISGAPHPYAKTLKRKQNALQSLAYLTFMVIIGPALWLTGIAYLLYNLWAEFDSSRQLFSAVAFLHTAAAFAMITFVVVHVYMTTTGKTVFHYIRTMITGYEHIELTKAEEAYLEEQEPELLRHPKG